MLSVQVYIVNLQTVKNLKKASFYGISIILILTSKFKAFLDTR